MTQTCYINAFFNIMFFKYMNFSNANDKFHAFVYIMRYEINQNFVDKSKSGC